MSKVFAEGLALGFFLYWLFYYSAPRKATQLRFLHGVLG